MANISNPLIDLSNETYPPSNQSTTLSNQSCDIKNQTKDGAKQTVSGAAGDLGGTVFVDHSNKAPNNGNQGGFALSNQGELLNAKDSTGLSGKKSTLTGPISNTQQSVFTDSHSIGLSSSPSVKSTIQMNQSESNAGNLKRVGGLDANLLDMGVSVDDTPVLMAKQGK